MGPMAYMGVTKVTVGLLGMALTFAPRALYDFYDDQPAWWGLAPTTDQMMSGALMATEQVLIMGVAFGVLFMRGLRESEIQAQREERLMDRAEARAAAERAEADAEAEARQRAADTGFMRICAGRPRERPAVRAVGGSRGGRAGGPAERPLGGPRTGAPLGRPRTGAALARTPTRRRGACRRAGAATRRCRSSR
jgi:hypothetical protein